MTPLQALWQKLGTRPAAHTLAGMFLARTLRAAGKAGPADQARDEHGQFGSGGAPADDVSLARDSPESRERQRARDQGPTPPPTAASSGGKIDLAAYIREAQAHPKAIAAVLENKGQTTRDQFSRHRVYTPERQQLHDDIIHKGGLDVNGKMHPPMLNPKAVALPGMKPVVTMLLGLPGSGKTTALHPLIAGQFTTIDPDAVKDMLPGYHGSNASLYHAESAKVANWQLLGEALDARHNIVFDGSGRSYTDYMTIAQDFHAAGYDVDIMFADVTVETAVVRAHERFLRPGGRHVPLDYITEQVGDRPARTYASMKKSGIIRRAVHYDTNTPVPTAVEDVILTPS